MTTHCPPQLRVQIPLVSHVDGIPGNAVLCSVFAGSSPEQYIAHFPMPPGQCPRLPLSLPLFMLKAGQAFQQRWSLGWEKTFRGLALRLDIPTLPPPPRASLELCLFAFSSPQLGRAVQLLHQRGVRVRVVTDCDYMALNGSQIGLLRKAGIQVRHDQDLGYMHHKFAIVDKRVLITGSLNWTTQAIQNNRENVLIMEDDEYVRLFLEEFERIWEEFNPTKYTFFPQKKKSH
ncbi:PREDICTED: mitochondrial cardiolipin hydrolase [Mandrillus leucophaeus]|uniref:mitochondrial cardiolipin hydrolase n=1 Tax=Mandrillus leucophaeus TaxID=9568 RepID=UPI0005F3E12B|nr:PREDICTED: mitochondrial cardiolipin hydrolase [Mandrillus leucophaeus]